MLKFLAFVDIWRLWFIVVLMCCLSIICNYNVKVKHVIADQIVSRIYVVLRRSQTLNIQSINLFIPAPTHFQ